MTKPSECPECGALIRERRSRCGYHPLVVHEPGCKDLRPIHDVLKGVPSKMTREQRRAKIEQMRKALAGQPVED